jgi:dihydroflavonol-4-reductase
MRIGILGATGMLGHHAAVAARVRGHEVVVLARSPDKLARLGDLATGARRADLDQIDTLVPALTGLDGLIHAAGYYPGAPRPWQEDVERALAQSRRLYDACAAARVDKVLYVGGAIALPKRADGVPADESLDYPGRPADPNAYLQVKWALDRLAHDAAAAGQHVVTGIPAMTFGEYDYGPTTGRLLLDIAAGRLKSYLRGNRNVVYAGDAGRGLVLALEHGRAGERYFLTGENIAMDALTALMAEVAGVAPPRAVPLGVARTVARLSEWRWRLLGGALPKVSPTAIAVMTLGQFLDGGKAQRELGYVPEVTTREALARALGWFREVGYLPVKR